MIAFVMANSPLRFRWMDGYSDYYPELPGGMPNGRSIEPDHVRRQPARRRAGQPEPGLPAPFRPGMVVFSSEYKWLNLAAVNAKGVAVAAGCLARGTCRHAAGQKPLTMGQALAAGLRAGLHGRERPGAAEHAAAPT